MFDTVSWTGQVMYPNSFYTETQDDPILHNFLSINAKLTSYPNGNVVQNAYAIVAAAGHLQEKPTKNTSSHGEDMISYFNGLTSVLKATSNTKNGTGWGAAHVRQVISKCKYRRFFITEKGYLGLGPGYMELGDQVTILFGGETPFILRKFEDHFKLIGESYIHGIMEGEVIQLWEAGELEEQWFEIR
jgi:hypothetical protein